MKHHKLRIAWSVACGYAAVLLVAFWVRSYWRTDIVTFHISSSRALGGQSYWAGISLIILDDRYYAGSSKFLFDVTDADGGFFWNQVHYVFGGFAITSAPHSCVITMPDWFPILVIGALGGAPWLPWSTRFSLRTLLIATTLVAVGLGLIVWAIR